MPSEGGDVSGEDDGPGAAAPSFAVARNEAGEIVVTITFRGPRFDGGRLPVAALPSLAKMEELVNSVARDVDLDINEREHMSRLAKVQLVLTGDIDDGSAILKALVVPASIAISVAAILSQGTVMEETVRRLPIVATQIASGSELEYPTSPRTVRAVMDLSQTIKPDEAMVISVSDASTTTAPATAATPPGSAEFTPELGERLRVELDRTTPASFFVTGTLRMLEDRGDDGYMTLVTRSGQFRVPATAEHRQQAAKMYGEARSAVFAVSGRGVVDGAGRMKQVDHLSELTAVDRMFDMKGRLEELRNLADDPENAILAARIGRASTNIPTLVHHTGFAPGLFLTDENTIEARWHIGSIVTNVTFGQTIEAYIFNQSTEQIVYDAVIDEADEILPAWSILGAIQQHRSDDSE